MFIAKVINATPYIYHFLTPAELRAVTEEGQSVGIKTACHCSGGQSLDKNPSDNVAALGNVKAVYQGGNGIKVD